MDLTHGHDGLARVSRLNFDFSEALRRPRQNGLVMSESSNQPPARRIPEWAIHPLGTAIPDRLRALVRRGELWIVGLAAVVGIFGGALVTLIGWLAQSMHIIFFGLQSEDRLSALTALPITGMSN